ncbi:MAG: RdgB/HAM1 family non-canonical purine NTP pyrophosphatase [Thermoguttaceae bacterium]
MHGFCCTTLVLATGNPHKVRELEVLLRPLQVPLLSLADFPQTVPVEENGETLAENARRKAIGYARALGEWVLADDTGLEVDALGGAPGVRSARFAGQGATMAENRAKLLQELAGVPETKRWARFVCQLAVADPGGEVVAESQGECRGRIRLEGTGQYGFGYDSLLEIAEYRRTLAELGPAATAAIGHRGRAVRALLAPPPS